MLLGGRKGRGGFDEAVVATSNCAMRSTTGTDKLALDAKLEERAFDRSTCFSKVSMRFFFSSAADEKEKPTLDSDELLQSWSSLNSTKDVSIMRLRESDFTNGFPKQLIFN
mmetsp:Transcript_116772/g.174340  ORF Transcript_116772/g.174340 Transcript_116772/m.174340 type:complete len:111 (+) Transcript_116772:161-493(+)